MFRVRLCKIDLDSLVEGKVENVKEKCEVIHTPALNEWPISLINASEKSLPLGYTRLYSVQCSCIVRQVFRINRKVFAYFWLCLAGAV